MAFTEFVVEDAALAWLKTLGYAVLFGPAIAGGEPGAERLDPACRHKVRDRSETPVESASEGQQD